ncbi:MAG: retropepsin-like aspartic protease [Bacteroidota bacterium]|nr:retropepsin-like aspartic protease [Bacteroidota bacterium]
MNKKKTEIPINLIEIEGDGYHLMLNIRINRKKANMLLDTGASRTVFDAESILRFLPEEREAFEKNEKLSTGLGTNTLESQITELKSIKIGDLRIKNYRTVFLNMSHVNEAYRKLGLPAIDGVIGSDLLVEHNAVIDYGKSVLHLNF